MRVIEKVRPEKQANSDKKTVVPKNAGHAHSPENDEVTLANEEIDEEIESEGAATEEEQASQSQTAMSAGYALDGLLAEAAASASLLIVEAEAIDRFGYAQEGGAGSSWFSNPFVLGGTGVLGGLAAWGIFGGGGNKPPTIDGPTKSVSTNEDTPLQITINASDKDALTYAIRTNPGNGSASVSGNVVTYSPNPDFHGFDSLEVTATDTKDQTVTQAISIEVTPVNDPPFFLQIDLLQIKEGEEGQANLVPFAVDVDGDELSFAQASNPQNGSALVLSNGTYFYTPRADFAGQDQFMVTVTDPSGAADTATANVLVIARTMPTGGEPPLVELPEDSTFIGQSGITDADGDSVTYSIAKSPDHGRLELMQPSVRSAAEWLYAPNPDYNGPDAFEITGTSVDGSFTEKYVVSVTPVNDPPTAPATDVVSTEPDTPVSVALKGEDLIDMESVIATVPSESRPANGTLAPGKNAQGNDEIVYTPNPGFSGDDQFTIVYRDAAGATASTEVIVRVGIILNDPPTGTPILEKVTDEDTPLTVVTDIRNPFNLFSPDLAITQNPMHGTVTVTSVLDKTFNYIPTQDYNGTDFFIITGTNSGGSFSQRVEIVVNPVNDEPTAPPEPQSLTTLESTPVGVPNIADDVDLNDANPDVLTPSVAEGDEPESGEVTIDGDKVTYTPDDGFTGSDRFFVTYTDRAGASVRTRVEVRVDAAAADRPPTGTNPIEEVTLEDTVFNGSSDITDPDGDPVTFTVNQVGTAGTVTINQNTGAYIYTPPQDYDEDDSFTITGTAKDLSFTQTVMIDITPVNDAPIRAANATDSIETEKNTAKQFVVCPSSEHLAQLAA